MPEKGGGLAEHYTRLDGSINLPDLVTYGGGGGVPPAQNVFAISGRSWVEQVQPLHAPR